MTGGEGGPITVVIADDHPLVRKGVADILRGDTAIRLVGEASDGEAALRMIRELGPRLAILDISMPKMTGLEVAAAVQAAALPVRVALVTMHGGEETLQRALALGVRGFVSKESAAEDILACVHLVASGRTYLSASFERAVAPTGARTATPALAGLTAAERNVLRRIAKSLSTREIAEQLGVSPKTVENQRASICLKLCVSGNNALVRFAMEHAEALRSL
jgi:DNA-binding NarL/FixJ family response regulator